MPQLDVLENTSLDMPGAEKAAALFLVLEKENAIQLAKHFSPNDIRRIIDAAAELQDLDPEVICQILNEFGENYNVNSPLANMDTLSQYFLEAGSETGKGQIAGGAQNRDISQLDEEIVTKFFEDESPQICAVLIQVLDEEMIVRIFSKLQPEKRNELFNAYLNRKTLGEELQSEFEADILELLLSVNVEKGNVAEIEKSATLINQFLPEISDQIINHIEESDPETAIIIKKSLFSFSAVEILPKEARALLLDGMESSDISNALSESSEAFRETIYEVLSQRNKRMVEAELTNRKCSAEDMIKSQKIFVAAALKLSREGKISLPDVN